MNIKKLSSIFFLALFACQASSLRANAISDIFSWCVQRPKTVVTVLAAAGICAQEMRARKTVAPTKSESAKIVTHTFDEELPANMKKAIDEHFKCDDKILQTISAQHVQLLPVLDKKWFIKFDTNRIEGAKKFAQAINELQYANFALPKKYRYAAENGLKYVIAEKIEKSDLSVTCSETEQIKDLAKKLKWTDAKPLNFIKAKDGKIYFIDTDTANFDLNLCDDKMNECAYQRLSNVYDSTLTWAAWLYCASFGVAYGIKNLFTHNFGRCVPCSQE